MLWVSVKDNVSRCSDILERYQQMLEKVSADGGGGKGILRRTVSKIRLDFNMSELDGFQSQINIYHQVLDIALAAINASAGIRRDRTDAEVFERLGIMEDGIEVLVNDLGKTSNPSLAGIPESTNSVRGFVKAARAFHSSASSFASNGSTITRENSLRRDGSIFRLPLSEERVNNIKNWIPSSLDEVSSNYATVFGSASDSSTFVREVESLPQLRSTLENLTQVADRYEAIENQKNFIQEETISSLQARCRNLERRLDQSHVEREDYRIQNSALLAKMDAMSDQIWRVASEREELQRERQSIEADRKKTQEERQKAAEDMASRYDRVVKARARIEVDKQMMQEQRSKAAEEIIIRQRLQNELVKDRARIEIDKQLILKEWRKIEEENTKAAEHLATQQNELFEDRARIEIDKKLILEEKRKTEEENTKAAGYLATQRNELETAQARIKVERQSFGVISKQILAKRHKTEQQLKSEKGNWERKYMEAERQLSSVKTTLTEKTKEVEKLESRMKAERQSFGIISKQVLEKRNIREQQLRLEREDWKQKYTNVKRSLDFGNTITDG